MAEIQAKILVVDDDADIREVVRILLEASGYHVTEVADGMSAVAYLKQHPEIDLVIMDIMMPGLSGIDACKEIRNDSTVPILVLTARTMEPDMCSAYENGGDDYLSKPFSQTELLLKVHALLRRYHVYCGKPQMPGNDVLHLDYKQRVAVREGERIDLTDKEFKIIQFLLSNRGRPVDVQSLYEGVWQDKYMPASTNTVMVHVLNLRKKLEADPANPTLIRTVWGKGYQID